MRDDLGVMNGRNDCAKKRDTTQRGERHADARNARDHQHSE
jgi:hypothetical protein